MKSTASKIGVYVEAALGERAQRRAPANDPLALLMKGLAEMSQAKSDAIGSAEENFKAALSNLEAVNTHLSDLGSAKIVAWKASRAPARGWNSFKNWLTGGS